MDWSDINRVDEIEVQMLTPRGFANRGKLDGVILNGSSISWGYYADNRVSATIKTVDDNYIDHSFLRVVHRVPEWGYSNTLGTFAVHGDDANRNNGAWETTYDCVSAIALLEKDYTTSHFSICVGAYVKQAFEVLFKGAGRPYVLKADMNNYRYKKAKVYELSDSRRANLYDMCDTSGNRADVDGNGNITISKYLSPSSRQATWEIRLDDPRTNAIDGLSRSSDRLTTPNMVLVKSSREVKNNNKTEKQDIWGYAKATGSESFTARGYTICEVVEVDKVDPQNSAGASKEAQKRLKSLSSATTEWTLTTLYLPIKTGDIVTLVVPDGKYASRRKCLVKNLELSLDSMTQSLTLKEV